MENTILIGAPIYKREWILPYWFEAIENQTIPLENLGFIFELGDDDDATHEILWEWQLAHPEVKLFDPVVRMDVVHHSHPDGHRTWEPVKYENMVTLRNGLLDRARCYDYEAYFSLDSDIILEDPKTLEKLLEYTRQGKDVVSPLMYMTPNDTNFPSAMTWMARTAVEAFAERQNSRYNKGEIFKVDVVMAAVMMSKDVIHSNVRYRWHRQGEDLGFALALNQKGFESWAAWDIYCPHLMHKAQLQEYLNTGFDIRKLMDLGQDYSDFVKLVWTELLSV